MAIKQTLVDDLDETTEGAETHTFGLDGITYEIDLADPHFKELSDALEPFIKVARRKGAKRKVVTVGKAKKIAMPSASTDLNAIRDWAGKKGIKVSDRGRVPKDVVDQFNAEHNGAPKPAFSG